MQVEPLSSSPRTVGVSGSRPPSSGAGFQAALAQVQSAVAETPSSSGAAKAATKPTLKEQYAEALNFFRDYLSKSPAQHLREAIMKEMGITEEELAALPPAEHAAKEGEIERRMRERMLGSKDGEMPQDNQQAAIAAASMGSDPTYSPDKPLANQTVIANLNAAAKGLSVA